MRKAKAIKARAIKARATRISDTRIGREGPGTLAAYLLIPVAPDSDLSGATGMSFYSARSRHTNPARGTNGPGQ